MGSVDHVYATHSYLSYLPLLHGSWRLILRRLRTMHACITNTNTHNHSHLSFGMTNSCAASDTGNSGRRHGMRDKIISWRWWRTRGRGCPCLGKMLVARSSANRKSMRYILLLPFLFAFNPHHCALAKLKHGSLPWAESFPCAPSVPAHCAQECPTGVQTDPLH